VWAASVAVVEARAASAAAAATVVEVA